MKYLSKHAPKMASGVKVAWSLLICVNLTLGWGQVRSSDGYSLSPNLTFRSLNIFVNIIYDFPHSAAVNPENNQDPDWPYLQTEGINLNSVSYLEDLFDLDVYANPHGTATRMFTEASFSNFVVLGDFIIVDIKHSTVEPGGGNFNHHALIHAVIGLINSHGGLDGNTLFGFDDLSSDGYDNHDTDGRFDLVNFHLRNAIKTGSHLYGTTPGGSGGLNTGVTESGFPAGLICDGQPKNFDLITYQGVGVRNRAVDYKNTLMHEIAHRLFGPNSFHAGGGQHNGGNTTNTFLEFQGGFSLMGGAKSSLVGACGYDRWRLDWRHPSNSAHRIAVNGQNSDISQSDGSKTYFLRDARAYGDAIRIELPYIDNGAYPQYIWIENHQVGTNDRLDFFQYAKALSCVPDAPGIYAYYQVGKHIVEGTSPQVYPSDQGDNLKMITAEGYYDIRKEPDHVVPDCWGASRNVFSYQEPNPFSGAQDQSQVTDWDIQRASGLQVAGDREQPMAITKPDGITYSALQALGDATDPFRPGTKINMSTNPAAVNTLTYHSYQYAEATTQIQPTSNTQINNTHTYLSGLSITVSEHDNNDEGEILEVEIRWDGYEVDQDVRWCSNIILKEELHVVNGATILLDQGRNPYQKFRDPNSGEYFPTTYFTSEPGSLFEIQGGSEVVLRDQSTMYIMDGADLIVKDGGILRVEEGCFLVLGGNITVQGTGKIIIECGADMCCLTSANVHLQDPESAIHYLNPMLVSSCATVPPFTGLGYTHTFNSTQDVTISPQIISSDVDVSGRDIYVGGGVFVNSPAKLTLLTNGEVTMSEDFEIATNAKFEIIQYVCP